VLNVALDLVLIPPLGIQGAAISWAVCIVGQNVAALIEVWVFLRMHPFGFGYGAVATAAAVCYGVLALLAEALLGVTVAAFAVYMVVATALFSVFVWALWYELELPELRRAFSRMPERGPVDEQVAP